MRAYDKDTGKVLWEFKIPAGPEGIPAVYEVDGREYVVISARPNSDVPVSAGGVAPLEDGPAASQGYYVFALPQGHSGGRKFCGDLRSCTESYQFNECLQGYLPTQPPST